MYTAKELQQIRYLVNEHGYPGMAIFEPNQIVTLKGTDEKLKPFYLYGRRHNTSRWYGEYFDKFPNVFKKLKYWEERDPARLLGVTLMNIEKPSVITRVHAPISKDGWFVWDNLVNSVPFDNYLPIEP